MDAKEIINRIYDMIAKNSENPGFTHEMCDENTNFYVDTTHDINTIFFTVEGQQYQLVLEAIEDDSEDDCSDKKDFGTCDNCKEETKIETVILCEECQQSQQLCSNCSQESFIYCWNCYSVIDLD